MMDCPICKKWVWFRGVVCCGKIAHKSCAKRHNREQMEMADSRDIYTLFVEGLPLPIREVFALFQPPYIFDMVLVTNDVARYTEYVDVLEKHGINGSDIAHSMASAGCQKSLVLHILRMIAVGLEKEDK